MEIFLAASTGEGWIDDFGIVLASAGLAVYIFRFLRIPVFFGYILAGLLIGPSLFDNPLISEAAAIQQISELGIIFLLFFIGMEFDLKRLKSVLGPSFFAISLQTLVMLYLAQVLAVYLGWGSMEALFFGSTLAISSSMVTIRVLRDQDMLHEAPAQYAVGILILEDILAVILLVVLAGVAVSQSFEWAQVWLVTLLMMVFTIAIFLVGRVIVPKLFHSIIEDDKNAEALTLMSVGLVMGISILALKMNFSPALGAFIAGTLFSQTQVAHKVETMNRSLHDVFAAVFFVSIGMQMQPSAMLQNWAWIFIITFLLIFLKISSCWLGLCLAGQSGKTALLGAIPKSQIGEFSFIIAGLGNTLGVMSESATGIAFGVAFLSILLTPLLTSRSERIYAAIFGVLPTKAVRGLDSYRNLVESLLQTLGTNQLIRLIRRPLLQIGLYIGLIMGAIIAASFLQPNLTENILVTVSFKMKAHIYWVSVGLFLSPFIFAVLRNLNAVSLILTEAVFINATSALSSQKRFRQSIGLLILTMLVLFSGLLMVILAGDYLPDWDTTLLVVLVLIAISVFLQRHFIRVNSRMEIMFMESFRKEVSSIVDERKESLYASLDSYSNWPFEMADVVLPEKAAFSGKRICDLDLREQFNVNVLAMGRSDSLVFNPVPNAPVFSGDRLILLGPTEKLEAASNYLLVKSSEFSQPTKFLQDSFSLEQIIVESTSILNGRTLADANVRKLYGVNIVGIQRGEEKNERPSPDEILHGGDLLLVAGPAHRVKEFTEICGH